MEDESTGMANKALQTLVYPAAISSKAGKEVGFAADPDKKWFVFRASYGRTEKAADVLVEDGTYTYIARRYAYKYVRGKRKKVLEELIPNLLFAYTTDAKADEYVKHTPELSFLTYYYNHFEHDEFMKNPPLTIASKDMDKFILATTTHNEHLLLVQSAQCHYKSDDLVRVVDGPFRGVEGRVARVAGQQRVVIALSEIGLISTAYIPTAFIEKIGCEG